MSDGHDGGIHTDADLGHGHVHEVRLFAVAVLVLLETLQQLVEHVLGHLAAAPLEIGEPGELEVRVQVMDERVERPAQRYLVLRQLQPHHVHRVLCYARVYIVIAHHDGVPFPVTRPPPVRHKRRLSHNNKRNASTANRK